MSSHRQDQEPPSGDTLRALALSEARLRRAQGVARLGSWEIDLTTHTMWGSDEAFRIYGLVPTADRVLPLAIVQSIPLPGYRHRIRATAGSPS